MIISDGDPHTLLLALPQRSVRVDASHVCFVCFNLYP